MSPVVRFPRCYKCDVTGLGTCCSVLLGGEKVGGFDLGLWKYWSSTYPRHSQYIRITLKTTKSVLQTDACRERCARTQPRKIITKTSALTPCNREPPFSSTRRFECVNGLGFFKAYDFLKSGCFCICAENRRRSFELLLLQKLKGNGVELRSRQAGMSQ